MRSVWNTAAHDTANPGADVPSLASRGEQIKTLFTVFYTSHETFVFLKNIRHFKVI
jgi:hypothetical protein